MTDSQVAIANGYIYIVGGLLNNFVYISKIAANGVPQTAITGTPLEGGASDIRGYTHAVVANGYIYIIAGEQASGVRTSTVLYAPLDNDGDITGAWITDSTTVPLALTGTAVTSANGYIYVMGGNDTGSNSVSSVYYTSTPRVKIGGSLDLVGYGGENLAEGGSGGELTAGNSRIVGTLDVSGNATLRDGLQVMNNVTITGNANTASAFMVLNATGVPMFNIDTTNSRAYIGNPTADTTGALLVLDTKTSSGDPTGVDGAMYYNSSTGAFRCYQYDGWRDCLQTPRSTYRIYTDLTGFTGGGTNDMDFNQFVTSAGGENFASQAGVSGHPGIIRIEVAANTGQAAIQTAGDDNQLILTSTDNWKYETVVRTGANLSDVTNTYILRAGFLDSGAYAAADTGVANDAAGCHFKYSHGTNAGEWQGTCVNNSATVSTCDLNIAVATSTWYRLTVTVTGGVADFRVNGATTLGTGRCQVSAQIPTSAVGAGNAIIKSAGATARYWDADYIDVTGQLTTSR
jgi:hypothetical protein